MPKMKTHSAASKRLRYTASGKIRRGKACGSHLLRGKSDSRRRRLCQNAIVDPANAKRMKRLLPYGEP